ncbi:MAG: macro domain-containing protein [Lachnospiraceae bacterium]|nr:macro domain-containing protein [Lachnospiraceae bacterium]
MPFRIIRNDITKVAADAIVNTANPRPVIGAGTDCAIYQAAGAQQLLAERRKIGNIPVGKAAVTSALNLPARYIIHTVGPKWVDGCSGEEAALRSCYSECLKLAESLDCESIAFPLLATGNYGFPKDLALKAATSVIYDFLMESDMMVYLVVFDRKAYDLSGKLFSDVHAYIDENYVSGAREAEYTGPDLGGGLGSALPDGAYDRRRERPQRPWHIYEEEAATDKEHLEELLSASISPASDAAYAPAPASTVPKAARASGSKAPKAARASGSAAPKAARASGSAAPKAARASASAAPAAGAGKAASLDEQLREAGETFREYLMKLIIERNLKNSEVYHGANISKQHFSKIMASDDYHPTKRTACALAISLRLSVQEANDLLEKAGMVLSRSSKFDIVIRYFLEHKLYNIIEDNIILDENGLELLGQS